MLNSYVQVVGFDMCYVLSYVAKTFVALAKQAST